MANAKPIVVWSLAGLLFSASQAHAAPPLAGTWVNVDGNTNSITRLEVSGEADGWVIHVWGKCGPPDCDWGAVPLHMAIDSADDRPDKAPDLEQLTFGVASWDHKDGAGETFIRTFMTLHVKDGNLMVESVDVFEKASGRPKERHHLRLKDSFKRAE
jgi:hypothetical protein